MVFPRALHSLLQRSPAGRLVGLLAALVLLGCQRSGPTSHPRTAAANEDGSMRGSDAGQLPSFDIEGDEPETSDGDVPYERYRVAIGDAPVRGPEDAPVTIVMFSDFECPYCAEGLQTMKALQDRYKDQIRVAYKAFPLDFHEHAFVAAMAARSAQEQGKFWRFHDRLFSGQGLDRQTLIRHAEASGMSIQALREDLSSLEHAPEVSRDMRQGRRMGVSSTPAFFVNGRMVKGAQPTDAFEIIVEQEIELAKKWTDQGVAPEEIYEFATADGYERVEYAQREGLDPDRVYSVPIGDSPTKGPADAPVTIVIFGDFECPYCARGHQALQAIEDRYGAQIRLVYKHQPLPFHSHAFLAARAAMAAHAQGEFWAYHDALYQREANFNAEDLHAIADELGLDTKKFERAINGTRFDRAIVADQQLALSLGVRGTPAYFINGRPLQGARPELHFRILIEEELERAKEALDGGVDPEKLYQTLSNQQLEGYQPSR